MQIVLNGQPVEVSAAVLADALDELHLGGQRIAVERNRELVPRRLWAETRLEAGDQIEVVQFVGGGRSKKGGRGKGGGGYAAAGRARPGR